MCIQILLSLNERPDPDPNSDPGWASGPDPGPNPDPVPNPDTDCNGDPEPDTVWLQAVGDTYSLGSKVKVFGYVHPRLRVQLNLVQAIWWQ